MIDILRSENEHAMRAGRRSRLAPFSLLASCALAAASAMAQNPPKADWSVVDIPSQKGQIFLVTGGTSGMGFEDAKALAAAGAQVVIAARDPQRGQQAIDRIKKEVPDARLQFERLDLADLSSVRALGQRLVTTLPRLDVLINNASELGPTPRRLLADTECEDLEQVFATNVLGPFRLTKAMLGALAASAREGRGGVVLNISSDAAVSGSVPRPESAATLPAPLKARSSRNPVRR